MSNEPPPACDATLLRRAQTGDAAAFATVYDRHARAAHRLAGRLVSGHAAVEDVVQESFLSLWRTDRYDARQGSVRAYLLSIVHNRAIDRLRQDGRRAVESPIEKAPRERLPAAAATDDEAERRDARRAVQVALAALPDAQRRALELSYYGGLTQAEIAMLLRVPIGTIKSRMRLGLERLGRDVQLAEHG